VLEATLAISNTWSRVDPGGCGREKITAAEGGISFVRHEKWEAAGGGSSDGSGAALGRRET
jgi:hypothetical protein